MALIPDSYSLRIGKGGTSILYLVLYLDGIYRLKGKAHLKENVPWGGAL